MEARMKRTQASVAAGVAGLMSLGVLVAPARAHHSFAMYDQTKTQVMTGKLTRYIPGGNHAQLIFEVLDAEGKTVMQNGKPSQWGVETGSAVAMARAGLTVDSFPVGTIFTVSLHPLRDGRPFGAITGQIIKCGNAMPKGGCTKDTGQVLSAPNN
jgi:hypothetical protein